MVKLVISAVAQLQRPSADWRPRLTPTPGIGVTSSPRPLRFLPPNPLAVTAARCCAAISRSLRSVFARGTCPGPPSPSPSERGQEVLERLRTAISELPRSLLPTLRQTVSTSSVYCIRQHFQAWPKITLCCLQVQIPRRSNKFASGCWLGFGQWVPTWDFILGFVGLTVSNTRTEGSWS